MSYVPYPANTEFQTDAGGRRRASFLTTLFDGKTLGADDTLIWENVGTGTGTWATNKYGMSVTAGQFRIRRGRHITPYFSGKSHPVELTFDGFQTEANVVKRAGYFSSNAVPPYATSLDGFWLENDGTTVRLRAFRSGTENLSLAWTSWDNYAAIEGYDWSNFTVIVFDFLWLGGTSIRLFIKTPEGFVLAHTFDWASTAPDLVMQTPNHSVRYEIRSTTGSGSFRPICSQVATEGTTGEAGKKLALYNAAAVTANAVGTIYALKGVRKVAAYRDTAVRVTAASIGNTGTSDAGIFMLLLNPTLSAPLTYAANSRIEEGTATTQTVSAPGRVLLALPASQANAASDLDDNLLAAIGMSAADVSDEIVLAYMPITMNQSVYGTLSIKEF